MHWNLSTDNIDALLLVAHPDDETIFCGGTMLLYPNCRWTVISITDDGRSLEFESAMESFKKLGVNIVSSRTLDQKNVPQGAKVTEMGKEKAIWEKAVKEQNLCPDVTFTHNEAGEYGHAAHRLLSVVADNLFSNVWNFVYPKVGQPYKGHTKKVNLTKDILEKKTDTFNTCYKSQTYLWEELADLMQYAFKNGSEIFSSD